MLKRFILPVFIFAAAAGAPAAPPQKDFKEITAGAAGISRVEYPDADSVLIHDHESVSYNADGTAVATDDVYIKILTEKGRRDYQLLSCHFLLPYSTVEFKKIEIIKPDGRIDPIDIAANRKVMTDRSQMNSNIYNPNSKLIQVGVSGLEVGDILHYITEREEIKTRVPDTWSEYLPLQYTSPIIEYIVEVSAPKSLPLRNIVIKDEVPGCLSYERREDGDRVIHRWRAENVPQIFKEPNMPPYWTCCQRLLLSTIPEWEDISKWYWSICEKPLAKITPEMRAKVAELINGAESKHEQIKRIFQFVSQQIRYMGITTEEIAPGYEPHDVDITFENRYGVCRDKAALLAAMLRTAGFDAFPVIIQNGPKKDTEVPQPFFNHAICGVLQDDGGYLLMDPTDEKTVDLLPSYLGDQSYLVARPEGETLLTSPISPAADNLVEIDTKAELDNDGALEALSVISFDGVNDGAYRGMFSRMRPEQRRQFVQGRLDQSIPGAKLETLMIEPENLGDMSNPLKMTMAFQVADFPLAGERQALIPPIWVGAGFGVVNFITGKTGLAKRQFPLRTEIACGVREKFSLRLDDRFKQAAALPEFNSTDNKNLRWRGWMNFRPGQLDGETEFLIKTPEFSPAEYRALKKMLADIDFDRTKQAVLDIVPPGESNEAPDSVVIEESVNYMIAGATAWTETRRVKRKIMSYAGKKRHSELKVTYNPVWEKVSVTATVTAADGAVKKLAPQEINELDAKWAAGAPRYPAEKTLVASLPGVEIGSIINYEIVKVATGKPFFSCREYFRRQSPLRKKTVTISMPENGLPTPFIRIVNDKDRKISSAKTTQSGRDIYKWTITGQSKCDQEDCLPPWWSFNPTLFFSTGNWNTYGAKLGQVLNSGGEKQPAAAAKAKELTADISGTAAKIIAIRDFAVKNIRPVGPAINELPLDLVTPADKVLNDGYGDNADRAVLLKAMLDAVGIRADFIIVSPYPDLPAIAAAPSYSPQPDFYNTVLLKVKLNDQDIYLNDTDQYARLGTTSHQHSAIMPYFRQPATRTAVNPTKTSRNSVRIMYDIEIMTDGAAELAVKTFYHGDEFNANKKLFAEMTPENRRRFFAEKAAEISRRAVVKGEPTTDFNQYPGTESFKATIDKFAVIANGQCYFSLPDNPLDKFINIRSENRLHPLYLDQYQSGTVIYSVKLPSTTNEIEIMPSPVKLNAGPLTFFSTIVAEEENGVKNITVGKYSQSLPTILPADEYKTLTGMQRAIDDHDAKTILFSIKRP